MKKSVGLLRSLCILAGVTIVACGCGGGDGEYDPFPDECYGYVDITYPTEAVFSTVYEDVYLTGYTFMDTIDPYATDTGVGVTWRNLSSGLSGEAYVGPRTCCILFDCWTCGTEWSAFIPLQIGGNQLEINVISETRCGGETINVNRLEAHEISGTVTKDDGSGLPDVTIKITGDLADNPKSSTQTDINGQYKLSRIPVGTHTLTPSTPCNHALFLPAAQTVNLSLSDIKDLNFSATTNPATYSVSGVVTYRDETPAAGVTVFISNDVMTGSGLTDGSGVYQIDSVPIGNYSLRPEIADYGFMPEMREADLCTDNLQAQDFIAIPVVELLWNKEYGMQGNEYVTAVETTSDNQIVIAAISKTYEGGDNGWVIKLDAYGHLIWQKSLGRSGTYTCWGTECPFTEQINDIEVAADGGYVLAGNAMDSGGKSIPWIVKLDADGNISWQRTYNTINIDGKAQAIGLTNDGGLIVAGSISPTDGSGSEAIWLAKLNADGTIVWQQAFADTKATSNTGDATAYAVQQTADGGYVLTGATSSYYYLNSYHNAVIMKVDANGTYEWFRSFADSPGLFGVIQSGDGGYVAAGSLFTKGLLVMKLNPNGTSSWFKTYNSGGGKTISATPDGRYLVSTDHALLKIDTNGDGIWQQSYTSVMYVRGTASVMQDGRYLAVYSESAALSNTYETVVRTYLSNGDDCLGPADTSVTSNSISEFDGGSGIISTGLTFSAGTAYNIVAQDTDAVEETQCWPH